MMEHLKQIILQIIYHNSRLVNIKHASWSWLYVGHLWNWQLTQYLTNISTNVKKKWPEFLRWFFGVSFIFSVSIHLTYRFMLPIDWIMLNAWNWIVCTIWISAKLYLILTSVLRLKDFVVNELWRTADSNGWRASSAPRTYWPRKFLSVYSQKLLVWPYAILDDGKMKFWMWSLYSQPHQLNLRVMGTCVSGAMVVWPNNALQYG
jgi:hypothetical protein